MNILIPHDWLKDYLETRATPQKIAECLSLCGASVEKLTRVKDDWLFEIEVTTNRVDMMSVAGIARELAAILPQFGILAKLRKDPYKEYKLQDFNPEVEKKLKVSIQNPGKLCQRVLGVVLDNVTLGQSPKNIQERLEKAGLRSLNNVVDITNYVMTEIGHPTHVFDYDRLSTKKLILRKAKKGEKIISLEKKEYSLPGGDIVIDDGMGRIIDLPGIIGTQNSIVKDDTQRVLFFIETNNPIQIRKTSMSLGIRTVAATLNEKGVDPELSAVALARGIQLFKQLTGAKIASEIYDIYSPPYEPKGLKIELQFIEERLGIKLQPIKVTDILRHLGFGVTTSADNKSYQLVVPSWRAEDIKIPEDIVEEVARIYGYHNLPPVLPAGKLPKSSSDTSFYWENTIKQLLKGWGYTEIYTYSLQSEKVLEQFRLSPDLHLKVKNPLSSDWVFLRTSLIPSLLEVVLSNKNSDVFRLFELSKVYLKQKRGLPYEVQRLTILSSENFSKLKGIIEQLFDELNLEVYFEPKADITQLQPEISAVIKSRQDNLILGVVGKIYPPILSRFSLNKQLFVADLNFDKLVSLAKRSRVYKPISQYPPIIEHLTFVNHGNNYTQSLSKDILKTHKLIASVKIIGTHQNKVTFEVLYQSQKRSLQDKEVGKIRKAIVGRLQKLGLELQGQLS